MKFFRNMDEMELHLSLNAIRVAWFFTVMALFIWGIWDCVQTGRVTAPMYLLIFQNLLYFLALQVGRWAAPGDRDGAQELPAVCPAAGSLPAGLRPAAAVCGAVIHGKPDSGAAEGGGAPAGGPGTGAGRHPPNHQRH